MATTENTRSLYLANANPRLLSSPNSALIITASAPVFHVDTGGNPDIPQITFNVISVAIDAGVTYSFSCVGGTLSNIAGNTAALNYSAMTADNATVSVSVTYRNTTYTATTKVSKLFDVMSGATGLNNALMYAYQRSATQPTGSPGTVQYSFVAAGITTGTLANGWQKAIPSGSGPLWVTAASASSSSSTDTVGTDEWSSPVVLAQNGLDGVSPALMSLSSTAQAFTYNSTGAETPNSQTITFTANLINTTGTATFVCTKYDASGASLGTVTLGGSGNTRTLSVAQFTTSAFRAVVTATLGGLTDTITVVRLADGAAGSGVSAIAGYLTNESVTVPTASDGSAPVLTGANGSFKVFQGTTDITSGCTFSIVGTPLVAVSAPTAGTGAYSVTGAGTWGNASLTTSVTFRASHTASGATIDQVFSITKAPAGLNGTSPAILTLSSTAQAITYNGTGVATPASQSISFTANLQNTTGTATFTCTKYDSAGASLGTVTLGGTGNTRTLTDIQFTTSAFRAVVTATLNGLSDTITIVRLADGAAGSGVSALAGYLTNESVNVPTAADGSGAVFSGVNGNFRVFQGTTDVTAGCTFSIVGTPLVATTAPVNATGYYSVTGVGTWANSSLTTSVTYRALHTASGATIDQVLTIVKALAGVQGGNGINSAILTAYRRTTTSTAPAKPSVDTTYTFSPPSLSGLNNSWTTTIPAASGGAYLWATTATAAATVNTDTVLASEWAAPQLLASDGIKGDPGVRGNVQVARAIPGSAWSDSEAVLAISGAGYGVPQNRDIVTLYNNSAAYSQQKYYDGSAWQALAAYFPGGVIVDGTLDATALKAKTITGDKIKAGAITASSIAVSGNGDNIVPDPKFKDLTWWGRQGSTVGQFGEAGLSTDWKGGASLYLNQNGGELISYSQYFDIVPGATYRIEVQVGLSTDFNGRASVYLTIPGDRDYAMVDRSAGQAWSDTLPVQLNASSPKGIITYSTIYTIPSSGTQSKARIQIRNSHTAGTIEVGSVSITRASDGSLIVDGAITAQKISAGAIGTNQLSISQGGAINSGQTAFDVGNGFWIEGAGAGHGARMSMGNSTGKRFICDPANNILQIVNADIPGINLTQNVPVVNVGADIVSSGGGTGRVIGSRTATVTGGKAPYTYTWFLDGIVNTVKITGSSTATISISANVPSNPDEAEAEITCKVTDANGLTGSDSLNVQAYFT